MFIKYLNAKVIKFFQTGKKSPPDSADFANFETIFANFESRKGQIANPTEPKARFCYVRSGSPVARPSCYS